MDLFDQRSDFDVNYETVANIPGLRYFEEVIGAVQEMELLQKIDASVWIDDLSRRVQHYGYKYDYRARSIDPSFHLGPLPDWLQELGESLYNRKMISFFPDQAIVNEYMPGQGISPHVDCEPCFGSSIASISLESALVMDFKNIAGGTKSSVMLPSRSLVVLEGPSRYEWTHAIAGRKSDTFNHQKWNRRRRVSITFRKVVLG